jgi:putative two-component system response regulator
MIVAFEHHRRFDGLGYPEVGSAWRQHPVSRLTCLADVFDAMTSRRSYKTVIPTDQVCVYIRNEGGKIFDPRMVSLVEGMLDQLEPRLGSRETP